MKSELKKIKESKLKEIEIRDPVLNDMDLFNQYQTKFKHNKWNMEYIDEYFGKNDDIDKSIVLSRLSW